MLIFFCVITRFLCSQTLSINCNNLYSAGPSSLNVCGTSIPHTATNVPISMPVSVSDGLALAPNFSFTAANPTFWTLSNGTYWYYNGTSFINTNHTAGASTGAIGGSKNFIYSYIGATGAIYSYNGTGNATLVTTIPSYSAFAGIGDIVGDDQDNFYVLRPVTPITLDVYSPTGSPLCSYSTTGLPTSSGGLGLAIIGNTVLVSQTGSQISIGTFSGSVINFTSTTTAVLGDSDFGNCYLNTSFSSSITASPGPSLSCTVPIVSLAVNSSSTPVSYLWSGPGIIGATNGSTIQANSAGIYNCSLTAAGCPPRKSVSTFTVFPATGLFTPTLSSAGNISCTNPTTQLFVSPNTQHTFLWTGPGIVGSNSVTPLNVNTAGVYTVLVTNTLTNCSATGTINVAGSVGPISISITSPSTVTCAQGPAVSFTAGGAAAYTWQPSSSLTSSIGSLVNASPSVTTIYTVTGTTGVCQSTAAITLSVNPNPSLILTGANQTVCLGSAASVTANGATGYTWNPGNLTGSVVSLNPSGTSIYSVTGVSNSCASSTTLALHTHPLTSLSVSASQSSLCAGNSSTLTAANAATYTWQPGNLSGTTIVVNPTVNTIYTVSATNSLGCISLSTIALTVVNPTLVFSPSSPTICSGDFTVVTVSGASSYTWQPGNFTGSSFTVNPPSSLVYTVTGSLSGCNATNHLSVTVLNSTLSVIATPTAICAGQQSSLSASGGFFYLWAPLPFGGSDIVVSPTISTIYTVTATTSLGCSASATVLLTVSSCTNTLPDCSIFYSLGGNTISVVGANAPMTYTYSSITTPSSALGLAIGPSFGFTAPNPTFWTTSAGTLWYYNGTSFINTNHTTGSSTAFNAGGSKNLIYLYAANGDVYTYNGTGNATLLTNVGGILSSTAQDIVGDDLDNFYLTNTQSQTLTRYNTAGVPTCTYGMTGVINASGGAFSIVGNTVNLITAVNYFVGTISGSVINFTQTPFTLPFTTDFANCPLPIIEPGFSSTITALPSATLSCLNPTIILSASSTLSPLSYSWSGPGIVTAAFNQSVQVSSAGIYTCFLRSCPTGTSIVTFTVLNDGSQVSAAASPSLICAANSASLSAAGMISYTWQPGNLIGSNHTVNPSSTTVYSVSGTTSLGCISNATVLINVTPLPSLTISPSSPSLCSGSSVSLSALGANTYTWLPGGSSLQNISITPSSTMLYTVAGTANNCIGSNTILVTVFTTPTVVATVSGSPICSGNSATLNAIGASSFVWLPGNLAGANIAVNPLSTLVYTVTGYNSGCSNSVTVNVNVLPLPSLTVSASAYSVCLGNSSSLSATGASVYTWNPGSSNASSITVTPSVSTIYTLTGSNGSCINNQTLSLIVNNNPTLTITLTSPSVCSGSTVGLLGSGALSYTWFPVTSNSPSITVLPSVTSIYTLSGSSSSGCTATAQTTVVVTPTPSINPAASPTAICLGNQAILSASGALTYTWLPSGTISSTISVLPTNASTQIYTVSGGTGNCVSSSTLALIVNPAPAITLTPSQSTICAGQTSSLTAVGANSYTWLPGFQNGSTLNVNPSGNTIYTVTGENVFACISSETVGITVNAAPSVSVSQSDSSICSGVTVSVTASGALSYTWQPGSLTGNNQTVSPLSTTQYTLVGSNATGCTDTEVFVLTVIPSPTLILSSLPGVICSGQSATLTSSGAVNYSWSPGSLTGSAVIVSPTATEIYTLIGFDSSLTCSDTKTVGLIVNTNPLVTAIPNLSLCPGKTITLSANGADSYTWNPGLLTGSQVQVNPVSSVNYTVTGFSVNGCSATAITQVSVLPLITLTVLSSAPEVCQGSPVTLTSFGAETYTWFPVSLTGSIVTVFPFQNTTYTVIGTTTSGCDNSLTISQSVTTLPQVASNASSNFICAGTQVTLTAVGADSYTWQPINSTDTILFDTPTATTIYTLTGQTGNCKATSTLTIKTIDCKEFLFGIANAADEPQLVSNDAYKINFYVTAVNNSTVNYTNVNLNSNLLNTFPYPFTFSISSLPSIKSNASGLKANAGFDGLIQTNLTAPLTSTLLAGKSDTIHYAIVVHPNGFSGIVKNSVTGETAIFDEIILRDSSNNGFVCDPDNDGDATNNNNETPINIKSIDLFIPEGFSPDGDGNNDLFKISGLNDRDVHFTVFNRWGNKVYETTGNKVEWDGTSNVQAITYGNGKLPMATYYFVLEFTDKRVSSINGFIFIKY